MTDFVRQPVRTWEGLETLPGTRWFRADLHIHTIDDLPGGRAKYPAGVSASEGTSEPWRAYARAFLRGAIEAGIGVLGITPHAVKCAAGPESSAVWQIVETWNTDDDDDGIPFRNKIFAVFPGFEPSFKDGKDGLHLQILFDPEIGRERFLKAFDVVMGGVAPYEGSGLQISSKSAKDALAELQSFAARASDKGVRYAVLAPHADSGKGLFSAIKAQVLDLFDHDQIIAIELGDNLLPEEMRKKKGEWFEHGLKKYRHALYHSSDAYRVSAGTDRADNDFPIGHRFTWLKLASPTIEGLRQAFLAHESRLRIAYVKDAQGQLVLRHDPPDPRASGRTWLRRLTVQGGASFFGGGDGAPSSGTTFELSPDLTCIIGSSMSGKSTLLDGLRVFLKAKAPADSRVNEQVTRRAADRFLWGAPEVKVSWGGAKAPSEPPLFFAQTELQALASDPRGLEEDVLTRLMPGSSARFEKFRLDTTRLDDELSALVPKVQALADSVSRAAQERAQSEEAESRLTSLKTSGYDGWQQANRNVAKLESLLAQVKEEGKRLASTSEVTAQWAPNLVGADHPPQVQTLAEKATALASRSAALVSDLRSFWAEVAEALKAAREHCDAARRELEQAMSAYGYAAEGLTQLRQLADRVKYLDRYRAEHEKLSKEHALLRASFEAKLAERAKGRELHRDAMREIARQVTEKHMGRVRVDVLDDSNVEALDAFMRGLKQAGITQWWKGLDSSNRPSPATLANALDAGTLANVGMSQAVATRFAECMTEGQRLALSALPCRDKIVLLMKVEDGATRPLSDLSGGQRVALVLSLLLSAEDDRPLFIDQPEDDIDNRYLSDSVLPALRALKGRRQVILATHNANLVVNGDADQVIHLEASFIHGWVDISGAIDDVAVRQSILDTVDGGSEAFALRQRKYGY